MSGNTVLISTIDSRGGGVSSMTRFVLDVLRAGGYETELAYYKPYSLNPSLSAPLHRLLLGKPRGEVQHNGDDIVENALGAWLPELEFTHYWPTTLWKRLMETASHYVSVSGNAMAALPFARTGRDFLAWVATDLRGDREERVASYPWLRRSLDRVVNYPTLSRLERQILQRGEILALSRHTRRTLGELAPSGSSIRIMPIPVDSDFFFPDPSAVVCGRIGFSARLHDPRKNLGLLVDAAARVCRSMPELEVFLVGGDPGSSLRQQIEEVGLIERIRLVPFLPKAELARLLQTLDVYVIPSHQEGLCIAALEAMACGCPVVSTRCGGPEEFVHGDETGSLVGFDAAEMGDAVQRIVGDRALRGRLSRNARQLVTENYNRERCERIFWAAFAGKTNIQ